MGRGLACVVEGPEGKQMSNELMTVNDVAEFLGLAVGTIYHLVSQKRIPCVRLSARCLRFRRSDLDEFIANLAQKTVPRREESRA
jgi:excisionase family DNA binding protein